MIEIEYLSKEENDPTFDIENISIFGDGFNYLQRKTGVFIDPYGNTRLYADHQRLLLEYFIHSDVEEIKNFVSYLKNSIKGNHTLLFIGD